MGSPGGKRACIERMGAVSTKEVRILVAGLDAAGKTTILYKLKKGQKRAGDTVNTIPTMNFNVESCRYKGIKFSAWDVGGQDSIRPLWRHYYTGTQGLIYVVDSNDINRIRKVLSLCAATFCGTHAHSLSLLVVRQRRNCT